MSGQSGRVSRWRRRRFVRKSEGTEGPKGGSPFFIADAFLECVVEGAEEVDAGKVSIWATAGLLRVLTSAEALT